MNLGEVPCDLLLFLPPASSGPPGYWPWHRLLGAQDNEQRGSLTSAHPRLGRETSLSHLARKEVWQHSGWKVLSLETEVPTKALLSR